MTTSLPSASTMPPVRLRARTYFWSTSMSRLLLTVTSAWVIWSAVALTREIISGSASLRQQVRSMTPTVLPETGSWIGAPACFQRGADAIGADAGFGVAEAWGQHDAVQSALKVVVRGQPGEHQAVGVGEDDADRLAVKLLAQAPKHRVGGAS